MTATDELRRLLDERGVKWEDYSGSIERRTVYMTPHGWAYVSTINDRHLLVEYHDMQPEQAIDATLGRGTCKRVYRKGGPLVYQAIEEYACSVCGNPMTDHDSYCSECGREVVNA